LKFFLPFFCRLGKAICGAATAGGKSHCQIKGACPASVTCDLHAHDAMTREEFRAVLEKIDSKLRALPATAQVRAAAYANSVVSVLLHSQYCCVLCLEQVGLLLLYN
jgi:hypothetical protein